MCPDRRQHRGAHPADARLFAAGRLDDLRRATGELSWLLGRGYASKSALKLVGDRYDLTERHRLAVSRAACAAARRDERAAKRVEAASISGQALLIDGFNLVITLEAAFGGGPLVLCRDGALRDLSGVHGSYRSVEETERALSLAGEALAELAPSGVRWLLDSPVSNSGRLAARLRETAAGRGWQWTVETVFNPDAVLVSARDSVAVTSDSVVIDGAARWLNFGRYLVERYLPEAWVIDLSGSEQQEEGKAADGEVEEGAAARSAGDGD